MSNNPRLHVRVSETNLRKLRRVSGDHGVNMGALVDEALTLMFTPPEKRPDAAIVQRLERVEDQMEKLETSAAFQTDLLIEFIFEWLRQRPGKNPFETPADAARAKSELEALTKRVVERANPHIWN
ncbi:hypothetical protein [Hyphomonas oceanitis]|uniref:CopG family transcriptional regulator n=1 Tax=Hyphomonas oceanitis SCH89 TaxID=1280953 RepID=A0A059G479_9PROT|nr:hypothetical protein [Hyphomonas oceanitis]KDA01283.1 hypothetical protein HOC_16096 [Hyphomonas oceanitis SCH89]